MEGAISSTSTIVGGASAPPALPHVGTSTLASPAFFASSSRIVGDSTEPVTDAFMSNSFTSAFCGGSDLKALPNVDASTRASQAFFASSSFLTFASRERDAESLPHLGASTRASQAFFASSSLILGDASESSMNLASTLKCLTSASCGGSGAEGSPHFGASTRASHASFASCSLIVEDATDSTTKGAFLSKSLTSAFCGGSDLKALPHVGVSTRASQACFASSSLLVSDAADAADSMTKGARIPKSFTSALSGATDLLALPQVGASTRASHAFLASSSVIDVVDASSGLTLAVSSDSKAREVDETLARLYSVVSRLASHFLFASSSANSRGVG
mmetsp:Transcript_9373/g.28454  ORF Transcript_9373/g.28454 Transcript_9373/m.28454 type:complete len:333 (-) Transcript_9373:1699-2697(-)|eukprot:scaffold14141_cov22-Tisochrysis_lutea.AAC.2